MTTTPFVTRAACGLKPQTGPYSWITPEMDTGHYGGPSPWKGADRSSAAAFERSCDHNRCASIWRAWQAAHQAKGWVDIAYTSGVCPHGTRYEGRPKRARTAANGTNDGNRRSLATVYIAGEGDPLTDGAKLAFLDEAERFGVPLERDHSDWKATACAGDAFRAWEAAGFPAPDDPEDPMNTRRYDVIRHLDDGRIAFTAPGYFRHVDVHDLGLARRKGWVGPPEEEDPVTQAEWDLARRLAFGGEEPEAERARD